MGGAFVALSDDATASWWNPAGIANAALVSVATERTVTALADGLLPSGPTSQTGVTGFAAGIPSLIMSFYYIRINEIAPITVSTETGDSDRNTDESPATAVRATALQQYGATFGQSFGDHFVVATTVRLVRGGMSAAIVPATNVGLEPAEDLDVPTHTTLAADIGAIVAVGPVRVGASMKYLNEPGLGEGAGRIELERQSRAGVALVFGQDSTTASFAVSADADLMTVSTLAGPVRHFATGAELWLGGRRLAIRGGVSWNVESDEDPLSGSFGVTVPVGGQWSVDGAMTLGSDQSRTGWAVGLGLTY
jgi:hypothetical protein